MAKVTISQNGISREMTFTEPLPLRQALEQCGLSLSHPCGGRGFCGKCAVTLLGNVSAPNAAEQAAGTRLSCQAILLGDSRVILPDTRTVSQIETSGVETFSVLLPMDGILGAGVGIGTTTIAMKLIDLESGEILAESAMLNPQTQVAGDVMGRIGAALSGDGEKLRNQVLEAIDSLLQKACKKAVRNCNEVDRLILTGNTTMLYLLTGKNTDCLAQAPFLADELFGYETVILDRKAYLPPCMNAFVGADITCAVLSSGMCRRRNISLLCDIGTNGEIALWKDGRLYVTSTAAGPAFEGAGISCGCSNVLGAIDRVWVEQDRICVHTIGEQPAVGVCGSGLIDAVAAFLDLERIDETGACGEDELYLRDGVGLESKDIRAVQVAKAAIAAGIQTLLDTEDIKPEQVEMLYIAGGFGSHLDVTSAVRIGLIPEKLRDRVRIIGNAALSGAVDMLRNREQVMTAEKIASNSFHVNLGGNPVFNENYMEQMLFPEMDE